MQFIDQLIFNNVTAGNYAVNATRHGWPSPALDDKVLLLFRTKYQLLTPFGPYGAFDYAGGASCSGCPLILIEIS